MKPLAALVDTVIPIKKNLETDKNAFGKKSLSLSKSGHAPSLHTRTIEMKLDYVATTACMGVSSVSQYMYVRVRACVRIYIYIYICVCVCVCVGEGEQMLLERFYADAF